MIIGLFSLIFAIIVAAVVVLSILRDVMSEDLFLLESNADYWYKDSEKYRIRLEEAEEKYEERIAELEEEIARYKYILFCSHHSFCNSREGVLGCSPGCICHVTYKKEWNELNNRVTEEKES